MFDKVVIISQDQELYHSLVSNGNKELVITCQKFYKRNNTYIESSNLYIIKDSELKERSLNMIENIRSTDIITPILFLSEQSRKKMRVFEKIQAIQKGVDEYLAYPLSTEEILASICALIRRSKYTSFTNILSIHRELIINTKCRKIYLKGQEILFTKLEYNIIYYLAANLNRAVTYKELYEAAWHKKYLCDDMNIMAHIHRIRKKMEPDPKHPKYIQNVYGVGYRLVS